MKPYPKYKDSGEQWLGQIPEHWEIRKLKYVLQLRKKIVGADAKKYDLLSLTLKGVIKRDIENPTGKFPTTFDSYQEVNENDFIFCNFDNEETPRAVGLSPYRGMITGAYDVLRRIDEQCNDRFLLYYFLWVDDAKRFKPLYKGLRKTIPLDSFLSYKLALPPKEEQEAMVAYLDKQTGDIDKAIQREQAMIDLLEERKQIIIQQAVTKGLNTNAKMKDSGIEWIGEMPEHWDKYKVKHLFKVSRGRVISREELVDGGEFPVYSSQTENNGCLGYLNTYDYDNEILTWTTDGARAGSVFHRIGKFNCTNVCGILCPRKGATEFNIRYVYYSLGRAAFYNRRADILGYKIMSNEMAEIKFTFPPLSEQNEIAEYLDKHIGQINKAIEPYSKMIALLQERKQIIINEVVTGKIKVL